ncbi:MAG: hypothetical protein ACRC62_36575 [Microcoleus sp.]
MIVDNYQLSIDRERGRSHYNYQRSIASSRRSHYNYQRSTIKELQVRNVFL